MTDQDQLVLPEVQTAPPTHTFTTLTELEVLAIRQKIIEAKGSMEESGIDLETMRNVIYTCRMKANPMQENESPAKAKKSKSDNPTSTKREKLTGSDVDNFLG